MTDNYDDIINMPYIKSDTRPHMSACERGAQFAPFSALTGYSDVIDETGRLTSERIYLDDYEIDEINRELKYVSENIENGVNAVITFFVEDERKTGGEYRTLKGKVESIDNFLQSLVLSSGEILNFQNIISIYVDKKTARH